MSGLAASETTGMSAGAETLRRTVAVVDMVGYSSIARILEENISAVSVSDLNKQIQTFMMRSLAQLPDPKGYSVFATTGDGIIVLFERADDAHRFAYQVHLLAREHNERRTESTAQRWFRVGIATGELSPNPDPTLGAEYAGTTIANAVRLESAARAGEIVADAASFAGLSDKLKSLYGKDETVKGKREERFLVRRCVATPRGKDAGKFLGPLMTRRVVIGSGATVLGGAALTAWLGKSAIERWTHPLPAKRFVAVVGWPFPTDAHVVSTITAAVDAISNELARAEAVDSNFYITSHHVGKDVTTMAQLNDIRESVGANLILAVSGTVQHKAIDLALHVVDPATSRMLRQETLSTALDAQLSLPAKAVQTAAELLNITHYQPDAQRTAAGTYNTDAYNAFQAAQALRQQPNDEGLEQAIAKYQEAVSLDPNYAKAYAELAWAYCRFYYLHKNPSALTLAENNCASAIALDPDLVAGHTSYAAVLGYRGDREGAFRETATALALDPTNARTLVGQAESYGTYNRWADAEESFSRALRIRPNDWHARQELGSLYNDEGKYGKALDEFLAVTLEVTRFAIGFANVGVIYRQLGKLDDAIRYVTQALELSPSSSIASVMAEVLRAGAKYVEAIEFAKKATALNEEDSDAWFELGDCSSCVPGGESAAKAAYRKSASLLESELQTNPTEGPSWMSLALAQVKAGLPVDASALLDRAEKTYAGDMDSQLRKVRILELIGRREDALTVVRACLDRVGTHLDRGAIIFQIKTRLDMGSLLKDPRFISMAQA
jgi:tetratricopeptide (TPR) repeat protein/class 3 adenylate cyclase